MLPDLIGKAVRRRGLLTHSIMTAKSFFAKLAAKFWFYFSIFGPLIPPDAHYCELRIKLIFLQSKL